MELEYIWFGKRIDKDKNLIEDNTPFYGQEICFSKKYNINFEYKNEIYTLKINNKKDINNKVIDEKDCKYYKTFYKTVSSNDIGINLTCFVGKNGAGKTLLLEYIKEIFCSNKSDGKLQYLIIWNDNGLKYDSSENIEKIEIESSDITLIKDSFPKNDNKVIFYSSTFNDIETYKDEEKSPNLFDISLNNVVLKENQKINEFIDSKNRLLGSLNYDPFKKGEISRRIRFYINHVLSEMFDYFNHYSKGRLDSKDNSTNIENLEDKINEDKTFNRNFYLIMPSTVYSDLYEYNNKNIFYSLISSDTKSELATFFKCSTDFINKKSIENDKDNVLWKIAKELWIITLFIIFKDIIQDENKIKDLSNAKISFEDEQNPEDFLSRNFKKISNLLDGKDSKKTSIIKEIYSDSKILFERINELYFDETRNCFKINLSVDNDNKSNIEDLEYFLKTYERLKNNLEDRDFLAFEFLPRYSLGESGIMTLFSRFYELFQSNKPEKNIFDCTSLFIMIDEGEIGYHPEWCKKYVHAVLSYIQEFINKIKRNSNIRTSNFKISNIHIMLTTNSPIMLSDILSEDVFYLENKTILQNKKNTFGSNILDLYSDSFFIEDGLIGDYAKQKIEQIIKFLWNLNKKNNTSKQQEINSEKCSITKEECAFCIKKIGDSNIKSFLTGLYKDIFGDLD